MVTKTIPWQSGGGYVQLQYNGEGNGNIVISSTPNEDANERSMLVVVKTANNELSKTIIISQQACPYNFKTADGYFIQTADGYIMNVKSQ